MKKQIFGLDYKTFFERKDNSEIYEPVLHYFETDRYYLLYYKSKENVEYYTVVYYDDIAEFSEILNRDKDEALDEWRRNHLYNAVRVTSMEFTITEPFIPYIEADSELYEEEEANEIVTKKTDIDNREESEDYEEFYLSQISKWQKQIMKEFNKLDIEKSLTDFKKKINDIMNLKGFIQQLPKIIKSTFKVGIKSAEEDLDMQIGYRSTFDKTVKTLTQEQLTGYKIDGKKWHGIKGVTDEQSRKIYDIVTDGIKNKTPKREIAEKISEQFDEIMPNRAKKIVNTETTRFLNESKLESYKASKIKGFKTWNAVMDNKTADLDRRLHIKYSKRGIPYNDKFKDGITGLEFDYPPTRPNCRCVLGISFKKHPSH